jgi:hypothetical protein
MLSGDGTQLSPLAEVYNDDEYEGEDTFISDPCCIFMSVHLSLQLPPVLYSDSSTLNQDYNSEQPNTCTPCFKHSREGKHWLF